MIYVNGWNDDHGALVHYENGVLSNFNGPARVYTKNLLNTQFFFNGVNKSTEVHAMLKDGTVDLDDEGMFTDAAKVTIQLMYGAVENPNKDLLKSLVDELMTSVDKSAIAHNITLHTAHKSKSNGIEW